MRPLRLTWRLKTVTESDLILRFRVDGVPLTGNPSSPYDARRLHYRRQIESAVRTTRARRAIPADGPLAVSIQAHRRRGRRGDADNIAKPVLDALTPVFGVDRWGRSNDERVLRLEVTINESPAGPEFLEVLVYRLPAAA